MINKLKSLYLERKLDIILSKTIILFFNLFALKSVFKSFHITNIPYSGLIVICLVLFVPFIITIKTIKKTELFFILFITSLLFYSFISAFSLVTWKYFLELLMLPISLVLGYFVSGHTRYYSFSVELFICLLFASILIIDRGYIYASGLNYLLLSNILVFGFVVASFRFDSRALTFLLQLVFMYASLMVQARFSFIFIMTVFIIFWLKKSFFITCIFLFLLLLFAAQLVEFLPQMTISRMIAQGLQSTSRMEILEIYFNKFYGFWLTGVGIGQSPLLFSNITEAYVHNFILELISEVGVLSLALIIPMLLAGLASVAALFSKKQDGQHVPVIISVLFIFWFLTFSKSFSVYDSYVLFFYGGLVLGAYRLFRTTTQK